MEEAKMKEINLEITKKQYDSYMWLCYDLKTKNYKEVDFIKLYLEYFVPGSRGIAAWYDNDHKMNKFLVDIEKVVDEHTKEMRYYLRAIDPEGELLNYNAVIKRIAAILRYKSIDALRRSGKQKIILDISSKINFEENYNDLKDREIEIVKLTDAGPARFMALKNKTGIKAYVDIDLVSRYVFKFILVEPHDTDICKSSIILDDIENLIPMMKVKYKYQDGDLYSVDVIDEVVNIVLNEITSIGLVKAK